MNDFSESLQNKSDDELLKIVYEFDQWSPDMLSATEKELSKRGILPMILQPVRKNCPMLKMKNYPWEGKSALPGLLSGGCVHPG